ncbi:MAG: hypothetical protein ACHP7P_05690 [Terriglobales bacterium]
MRWLHIPLVVFLLSAFAIAKSADEPLEALKARAENAKPQDQAYLFATIARREVNEADRFYTEGDITNATKAVDDVVNYAARATEAARKSGKHLKDTEILLRATARRLDDVGRTLNFDDRPYVEAAVKQVEKLRQQLLDHMFGGPAKESKP